MEIVVGMIEVSEQLLVLIFGNNSEIIRIDM